MTSIDRTQSRIKTPRRRRLTAGELALVRRGVESIVAYFCGRHHLADVDEVRQEAWAVALDAAAEYDPARGRKLDTWVSFVARRQVGAAIQRWHSVASLSRGAASGGYARASRVPLAEPRDDGQRPAGAVLVDEADPEQGLEARRERAFTREAAEHARAAMARAVPEMPGDARRAAALILLHVDAGLHLEHAAALAARKAGARAARRARARLLASAQAALSGTW